MAAAVLRRHLPSLPILTLLSALLYGCTSIALAVSAIWHLPEKNPRWVLASLAVLGLAMTATVLIRGVRFSRREATAFLAVFLAGATAMSFTTHTDLGAFSNGLVLPLLGIYTGWLLPRRYVVVFYLGLVGWLAAMISRGEQMLTAMAFVGVAQSVVATEVAWRLTVRISTLMFLDPLTQVLNRAGVIRQADRLIDRARAERTPLSLALVDLDDLRTINNTAGHLAGDAHLVRAVASWTHLRDAGAVIGRIGGDEFVMLLPRTTEAEAQALVEAAREASPVGWSFGVTEVLSSDTYDTAIERADVRMYAAKPHPLTPAEDPAP